MDLFLKIAIYFIGTFYKNARGRNLRRASRS
jgi:hypothetical protein